MQSEMQDLKSVFRLYFEQGGESIHSPNGETLIYQSKQSYAYDFVDRLIASGSISKEVKEKLASARQMLSETRNIHIIKSDRKFDHV